MRSAGIRSAALALLLGAGSPAVAAPACGGDFQAWMAQLKQDAAAAGISQQTVDASLDNLTPDPSVLAHDHGQGVFKQTFAQFSGRMVNAYRLRKGAELLRKYAPVFSQIEARYGVPGPVITAIWGLETDFGAVTGNFPTIRALVTLSYNCRRADLFRPELLDALRIVDRGYMRPSQLHGAWAGEIGQTQFLPSSYLKYAVDFDGSGRRDLIRDVPDVLASTANYLASYGWKRGEAWTPGSPNYAVLQQWNKSDVYCQTVAYFATRLASEVGE
jgi:lytic murein transglycosylase